MSKETFDRNIPPAGFGLVKLPFPEINRRVLGNGIRLLTIDRDNLPVVMMEIIVPCGSSSDEEGKRGVATLHNRLIDEGAGGLSAYEISDSFEFLGSHISVDTHHEYTSIVVQSLSDKLPETLELVRKVLMEPAFTDEDFERDQKRLVVGIQQYKDRAEILCVANYYKNVFPDIKSYASLTFGTLKEVESITPADVRSFYAEKFRKAKPYVIISGKYDEKAVLEFCSKLDFSGPEDAFAEPVIYSAGENNRGIFIVNKPGSVQTEVVIGLRVGNRHGDDYYARLLMNNIFGGQFNSRLNQQLREKSGLTYGINSRFNYNRYGAEFSVHTAVSVEESGRVLQEIINEARRLPVTLDDDEVNYARQMIINRNAISIETTSQLVSTTGSIVVNSLPLTYLADMDENLRKVTTGQVRDVAERILDIDRLAISLCGDAEKIKKSLDENRIMIPAEVGDADSLL